MKLETFYSLLDSIEPDEYGCINWLMNGVSGYYGTVTIDGKVFRVHRLALQRELGRPILPGHFACHHCDYPSCCNSDHLYEGDAYTNARDTQERNPNRTRPVSSTLLEPRPLPLRSMNHPKFFHLNQSFRGLRDRLDPDAYGEFCEGQAE